MNREGEGKATILKSAEDQPTADGSLGDVTEGQSSPHAVRTDEPRHLEPKIEPRRQRGENLNRSAPSPIRSDTVIPSDGHLYRPSSGITLADFLGLLRDSWRLVVGIAVLVLSGTLIGVWTVAPLYQANALLQVNKTAKGIGPLLSSSDFFADEALLAQEIEIIQSRSVLGQVIENLQLDILVWARSFPIIGAAIARRNIPEPTETNAEADRLAEPWLGLDEYAWGGEKLQIKTFEVPGPDLDTEFTLIAREGERYQLLDFDGQVVLEGAVGTLREQPRNGEPLRLFVSQLRARPGTTFSVVRQSRLKGIEALVDRLKVLEKAGEVKSGLIEIKFRGTHPKKVAATVNEIVNVYIRQDTERRHAEAERVLNLITQQLGSVKDKVTNAENALNDYRLQHGTADLDRETQALLDKIVSVETTISQLKRDRQELVLQNSPWRQEFQKLAPQHNQVAALDAQVGSLNNDLQGLRGKVTRLPFTQQEIFGLSRDLEVHSGLYTSLLNKAQELEVAAEGRDSNINVIDYADIPVETAGPVVVMDLVLGVSIGLFLGVGAAVVRRKLNEGIEDPDVIEQRLGLPIYAAVPHTRQQQRVMEKAKREEGAPAVLAAADPNDIATESLRSLRTSLNFAMFESNHKTIMVTSSAPGVGKSFVAVNLAAVLASAGERTLVIDADLRKGSIHKYLGIERGVGLSDAIVGSQSLIDLAIHKTKIERLDVITSGTIPPNPAELLMHNKFAVILREVAAHYDYTIVDTPPILAVTDAAIIGRMVDVTLLVVKAGMHPLREIEEAAKRLRQAGVNLSGVVFNGFEVSSSRYKYGKYSAYTSAYSKPK